jgi:hypothetical protein
VDYSTVETKDGSSFKSYVLHPGATLPTVFGYVKNPIAFRFPTVEDYTIYKLQSGFLRKIVEITSDRIIADEFSTISISEDTKDLQIST